MNEETDAHLIESDLFELIMSIFLMLFGFVTIASLILFFVYIHIVAGFMILLFTWPIWIGIFYGLFRKADKEYEEIININKHPKLNSIINELVEKTGIKRPYKVVLREGSEVSVVGLNRKKLTIGLVALKYLSRKELKAIIAHEYGHFAHKDTVMGYAIWRIELFLAIQTDTFASNIGVNFLALFVIPTFIVLWILTHFFRLTSLWYSRQVEFRADAFASNIVGKQEFANALTKYVVVSWLFDVIAEQEIANYLSQDLQLKNIYEYMSSVYIEENVKKASDNELKQKSKFMDTHPSTSERLEKLGVESVSIEVNKHYPYYLENQTKYEEDASKLYTDTVHMNVVLQNSRVTEDGEIYTYTCNKCDTVINPDEDIKCPHCGAQLEKVGLKEYKLN
jgi:Zn-dependent protease with chaperone function